MKRSCLVIGVCTVLLAGCWPYHYTLRPGVTGEVVSADTGAPISAAIISVYSRIGRSKEQLVQATTDANGKFAFAALRRWAGSSPMQAPSGPSSCHVLVESASFIAEKIPFRCSDFGPPMTNLQTIKLRKER